MGPKYASEEPPGNQEIDLSHLDGDYARAERPQPSQDSVADAIPDGLYEARVESVRITRTVTTGNPMILWKLRIQGPSHAGSAVTKIRVITQKTLTFLKEDLSRAGLELSRLSELQDRLDEMVDREVTIFKKYNPERHFTDVSFVRNRPVEADVDPPRKEAARHEPLFPNLKTGTDDDLPF